MNGTMQTGHYEVKERVVDCDAIQMKESGLRRDAGAMSSLLHGSAGASARPRSECDEDANTEHLPATIALSIQNIQNISAGGSSINGAIDGCEVARPATFFQQHGFTASSAVLAPATSFAVRTVAGFDHTTSRISSASTIPIRRLADYIRQQASRRGGRSGAREVTTGRNPGGSR